LATKGNDSDGYEEDANTTENDAEQSEIDRLTQEAKQDLQQIGKALSLLIGLTSRWSGTVELRDDPRMYGEASYAFDIRLNLRRQRQDVRWRSMIHEVLHTCSAGYNRLGYEALPGWEEGVVEALQRLLRPDILKELGVAVEEAVFLEDEQNSWYTPYLDALERLRTALNEGAKEFYVGLLATPIMDRPARIFERGLELPDERAIAFRKIFAMASAVLRQDVRIRRRMTL
jgi:hypothetical protein